MFFKNKKVRIFLTSPKALELLVKMTVSELDYQQISVPLKQGLEKAHRSWKSSGGEQIPPKIFACGADFRSVEFHDFSTCLQVVAKQIKESPGRGVKSPPPPGPEWGKAPQNRALVLFYTVIAPQARKFWCFYV